MSQTIACSLVLSPVVLIVLIRFCGSLRPSVPQAAMHPTLLALVVLRFPLLTSSSVLLHLLHWLHVEFRIKFKLACLAYKILSTSTPPYLWSLLTLASLLVFCNPQVRVYLADPRCRTVKGSRVFHASAPRNVIDVGPIPQIHFLQKAAENLLILLGFQTQGSNCISVTNVVT